MLKQPAGGGVSIEFRVQISHTNLPQVSNSLVSLIKYFSQRQNSAPKKGKRTHIIKQLQLQLAIDYGRQCLWKYRNAYYSRLLNPEKVFLELTPEIEPKDLTPAI